MSFHVIRRVMMQVAKSEASLPDPQVYLNQGSLRGKNVTSRKGRNFYAFQGIPYAKPPIGELRFQDPQEPAAWTGVLQAKRVASKCIQMDFFTNVCKGKEDCLYLNVYTPQIKHEGKGLSVMVWIHGGSFFSGSGDPDLYGPDLLLDQDVVLVTINYRLGVFGFLTLGSPEAPGNYGLKDQVAALRWVQKNIAKFGGNPECVTIFGESAGAACVNLLMLSPLARGLFHRAIVQSGSAYNPWCLQRDPQSNGFEAAAKVGCKQLDAKTVIECMRGINAKELAKLDLEMRIEKNVLAFFTPTIEPTGTENAFLTDDPRVMLARGDIADVPLIVGHTTHEGIFHQCVLKLKKVSIMDDLKKNSKRFVLPELGLKENTPEFASVLRDIINFYEKFIPVDLDARYTLMNSDVDCFVGVDELICGFAALRRQPVFYYQFSYEGGLSMFKKMFRFEHKGTAHGDELGYLFSRTIFPGELDKISTNDHIAIDRITKLWTEFARTGTPTPATDVEVPWMPVEVSRGDTTSAVCRYLDIGEHLQMKHDSPDLQSINFWRKLKLKYTHTKHSKL